MSAWMWNLIAESENYIYEEQNTVDNGQPSLGYGQFMGFSFEESIRSIFPILKNESTSCDEQSASNQTEEDINAFVDWCAQNVS